MPLKRRCCQLQATAGRRRRAAEDGGACRAWSIRWKGGTESADLGPDPVCAETGQAFGFREWRFRSARGRPVTARRWSSSFVSKPVPILPANTKSSLSKWPTRSTPSPTRLPCGSVNPPTTSSFVASHFILSQCLDRRCSSGDPAPLGNDPFPSFAAGHLPRVRALDLGNAV